MFCQQLHHQPWRILWTLMHSLPKPHVMTTQYTHRERNNQPQIYAWGTPQYEANSSEPSTIYIQLTISRTNKNLCKCGKPKRKCQKENKMRGRNTKDVIRGWGRTWWMCCDDLLTRWIWINREKEKETK